MSDLYQELDSGMELVSIFYTELRQKEPDHELLKWLPLYWELEGGWPLWDWVKKQRIIPRFWKGERDWTKLPNLELYVFWFWYYYCELRDELSK